MDGKHFEESLNRVKNPVLSSTRIGQPERRTNTSSHGFVSVASNTNPIICAVCGSKDYIAVNSQGWSFPQVLKKNPMAIDFPQTCGPISPIPQAFFPQLSLFHYPSNLYYSQLSSNLRFPLGPMEKFYGDTGMEQDISNTFPVNCDSLRGKSKNCTNKIKQESYKNSETSSHKSNTSHANSSFTTLSEVRNYPLAMHPPFMSNFYPIFPYTYAFPMNHPLIPVYLPLPEKWQKAEPRNVDDNMDGSVSNSPMGDAHSMKNEDKKSELKDENTGLEYDFEVFARELMLDHKSNYDDDEEDEEINLDEITSSLKMSDINSGREINSEKFFNSKEKLNDLRKEDHNGNDIQNWRVPPEINMQDCCIRTLSNENLWYEAHDNERKNWNSNTEYEKDKNFRSKSKQELVEIDNEMGDNDKGDGVFYEANTIWGQEKHRSTNELETIIHPNWKKNNEKNSRRPKAVETADITSKSSQIKNEWSKLSKTELNAEIDLPNDKHCSSEESTRLSEQKDICDFNSKIDVRLNSYPQDTQSITQIEKNGKIEFKENEQTQSPLCTSLSAKFKKEEKSKPLSFSSSKYDSLKIPVYSNRRIKRQDELKKRWLA